MRNVCCFFGHRDTPREVAAITDLIVNNGVNTFYVGNQGELDSMARTALKSLNQKYPYINYNVVLAYMPKSKQDNADYADTIYPDGMENVPLRFAVDKRNKWMLERADYVIAYIAHSFGGAAKYYDIAVKRGKTVINLYGESALSFYNRAST